MKTKDELSPNYGVPVIIEKKMLQMITSKGCLTDSKI